MTAYAALVSVMQIIDQIQHHPISFNKKHSESLTANVTFLQQFLEGYNPHVSYSSEADPLESRIAQAAYAAEDVIESSTVDWILARSTNHAGEISSAEFYEGLKKVIEEMDLIKIEIKKMGVQKKLHTLKSATNAGSFRSSSTARIVTKVGLDDALNQMLEKMVSGGIDRQVIPIIGMGGLGKTTLARNVFTNPLIKDHFDICGWSTVSQEYDAKEILREILDQVDKQGKEEHNYRKNLKEDELGVKLYKHLIGRRYMIVMDDIWSIETWDRVNRFFPENENGSRIVVTTRLSNLASQFNCATNGFHMKFLDEASSWDLFSTTVFGEEIFPLELEDVGKKIVEGCKGLPLSIVVIGGLLSKSEPTRENWELIEKKLNSIVNSEDNGNCLQTLHMSYNNLPCYIKPCFLYLGVFDEDERIPVHLLIALLVAEGIIKPVDGKSLEEVAEDCIEELVDRNLVLVEARNRYGVLTLIKIHDLLRDVCLRESRKDKFLCVLTQSNTDREFSHGILSTWRRIGTSWNEEYLPNTTLFESVEAALPILRTLIGKFPRTSSITSFRLLRVCLVRQLYYEEIYIRLVNLRVLYVYGEDNQLHKIPFLVNLQTLILYEGGEDYVLEIWKMPQLRHVIAEDEMLCLPDPPCLSSDIDLVVLENLQTLSVVRNLKFGDQVLKRIPNVKRLKLGYYERGEEELFSDYCLNNLHCLHKLQVLRVRCSSAFQRLMRELTLPYSLKKLTLRNTKLPWEEMTIKIGWLPLLQVLKLKQFSFTGSEWRTIEGQFSSLKFLLIERCDLEYWTTDEAHFPRLEHLVLCFLKKLREIPSSIGDIPTLRSIDLYYCSGPVVGSAGRIVEEQVELGNQDIELRVFEKNLWG